MFLKFFDCGNSLKKWIFFVVLISSYLFLNIDYLNARWTSLGFNDPWNEGLMKCKNQFLSILDFCLDSEKKPHLIVKKEEDSFYIRWNGENWENFAGSEFEKFELPNGNQPQKMRLDSNDNPHFIFLKKEDSISSLIYLYWTGEGWSEPATVAKTNYNTDDYILEGGATTTDFILDDKDNPHFVYVMRDKTTMSMYVYYRYLEDGELKSIGQSDESKGGFNRIKDGVPNRPTLQFDSRGYPHIIFARAYKDDSDSSRLSRHYAYWDGDSWTGVEGSHTLRGLPKSDIDESVVYGLNFYFYVDINNNVHFIYPALINNSTCRWPQYGVIYLKWDGTGWVGLNAEEEYTVIDLDMIFNHFFASFNNENILNILTHSEYDDYLRYYYWNDSSFQSFGGTDQRTGIIPNGKLFHEDVYGIESIY